MLLSLFLFIYLIVCLLLIFVILLQSGEGGGLSGLVGSGSSLTETFGAHGAEKTLKRWTAYLAVIFLVLTLSLTYIGAKTIKRTSVLDELSEMPAAAPAPAAPAPAASAPATTVVPQQTGTETEAVKPPTSMEELIPQPITEEE